MSLALSETPKTGSLAARPILLSEACKGEEIILQQNVFRQIDFTVCTDVLNHQKYFE